MNVEKSTMELQNILENTPANDIETYLTENRSDLLGEDRPFAEYMRNLIKTKKLKQQDVFLFADIPERYGYKLLSEEKRTRKRDVIIRLCYGAKFTLTETQRALKIYGMSELYARLGRDAVIMIAFNERTGSIIDVDEMLMQYGFEPLEKSGEKDF